MLLPRFGIRGLMAGTALCALAALVVAQATAGRPWAIGLSVALAFLAGWFALSACIFLMALGLGTLTGRQPADNPFAGDAPPPQLLRPSDPEG